MRFHKYQNSRHCWEGRTEGQQTGQPSAASGTGCGLGTGEAQRGSESLWSKSRQSWRAQVTLSRAGKQRWASPDGSGVEESIEVRAK